MDSTKIRKSLEYINDFISDHERKDLKDYRNPSQSALDARKGYRYLAFVLDDLGEMESLASAIKDACDEASGNALQFFRKIEKEPKDIII